MIRARLVSAAIGVVLMGGQAQAQPPAQAPAPAVAQGQVPLARIQALFANLKARGRNINGDLPWCYFFLSYDRARLDDAAKILVTQGYTVVAMLSQPNALPDGPPVWQLEVRRAEHLTPEGVLARDEALAALAGKIGSIYYDGLEIEPGQ